MSSTRITNKRINNFTIAFNATIESMVAIGIINNSDAIFFRKMFIKIRTDTAILNALSNCNIIIFFNLQIIEYKFHLSEFKHSIIIKLLSNMIMLMASINQS